MPIEPSFDGSARSMPSMTHRYRRSEVDEDVDVGSGRLQADMEEEDLNEELRNQPLLDSVRSLVDKERQLAGLQLEEKEREAELWRKKYMKLQTESGGIDSAGSEDYELVEPFTTGSRYPGGTDDDWDNLQAASKRAGDSYLGNLRRQECLDLSWRGIGKQDLDGIVTKLRWLRGLTSVDLRNNDIDDACAQPLKSLMALRQLRRLDLRENHLGPSAAKALLESIPRCGGLQVLRLEANAPFARSPGAGARLAAGLRAAVKAGGCRHLWSLSVTLDDFDGSFFMNAPRKTKTKSSGGSKTTGEGRNTVSKAAGPSAAERQKPAAHPMNALALARAFHPRAPDGGAGALFDEDGVCETATGGGIRGGKSRPSARSGRGSITSLGLPYARLHPRTVEELATHAISSLTHLDLSYCYVGPAGAAALARALGSNDGPDGRGSGTRGRGSRSLRSLQLPHNAVGDSGARALGRSLSNNRCLTSLSLASNGIGSAGGRALAGAFAARGDDCGGGSVLTSLDVGDNPLGGEAARVLVAAVTTAATAAAAAAGGHGGDGGGRRSARGATTLQIFGLDRVAGATVVTREAARQNVAAAEAFAEAAVATAAATLVAVDEVVSVQRRDAVGDDGLVQVYQILLDSRVEPPADQSSARGGGGRGRDSTLDIHWSFAANRLDACGWRVSRTREGQPEFSVKEGLGSEKAWETGNVDGDGAEMRDGYSRIRLRCNGWRKHDILKIFVRPPNGGSGDGRMRCCDLAIGLVGGGVSSLPSSTPYGLLWADPEGVGGDVEMKESWRQEDRPRSPSVAECAHVAFLMSDNSSNPPSAVERGDVRPIPRWDGINGGGGNDGRASAMHLLRQIHVARGGRIRVSWQAVLAATSRQHLAQAAAGGRTDRSGRGDWRQQPSCDGYSWAVVRTRGTIADSGGGGGNGLSSRAVKQGAVPERLARPAHSTTVRPIGTEEETGDSGSSSGSGSGSDKAGIGSSVNVIPSTISPWRWQHFEVETTAWLPGDLLSLWVRLDDAPPPPRPAVAAAAGGRGREAAARATSGAAGVENSTRRDVPLSHRPRVRAFSLRVVDDARAEDIVRRASCFPPRGPRVESGDHCTLPGERVHHAGALGEAASDCYFAPAFSVAATAPGVAAGRLDFAQVCPMNIAAAGGAWA